MPSRGTVRDRDRDAVSAVPAGRRERRRLEVFQRILDASQELFETKGFDETTVAEICEAADVAYGTFFNHFPTKSSLLVAMGESALGVISETLDKLTKRPIPIGDALEELFDGFAEELESVSPGRRALAARVQSVSFGDTPERRDRSFHGAFEVFLRKAAEDGRVRTDVDAVTLADLVSSSYATMSLSWVHIPDFPVRTRAKALAQLLGTALAPDRAGDSGSLRGLSS